MIFELEYWAVYLVENDKKLSIAFDNLERTTSFDNAAEPFFVFEKHLFKFAFLLRRLFEEAQSSIDLKNQEGLLDTSIFPVKELIRLGKTSLAFPGSIGPAFKINQSYNITVWNLCEQIIHHRLLNLNWPTPNGQKGFFVSSDRESSKRILFVGLEKVSACIEELKLIVPTNSGAL